MRSSVHAARPNAPAVSRPTSRRRAAAATKAQKRTQQNEPEEYPLAHDAATWDDDALESGWDNEEAQLADEIARFADD